MSYAEWIEPAWRARLEAAGLAGLRGLLDDAPRAAVGAWTALTKPGLNGRQRWRWELPDGVMLFVKVYAHTPLGEQLDRMQRQAARHSRAWWERRVAQDLAVSQIPALRVAACCEEMRGTFELRSAVLFERAAGEPLDAAWRRVSAGGAALAAPRSRQDLTRRLARFVAAFHQTGYFHRDLYLCHIFAALDPAARRAPEFCLIDLARVHRPRVRRMRWLLKDLSQLDSSAREIGATRTDRVRFLLAYLALQVGAPRARWYARAIVRRSDRILARVARKSRAAALA